MSKFSPYLPAYWDAMPVIQSLSLSLASFSVVLFAILFFHKRNLVDRVSLRLQAGIAFIDITNALLALHIYQTPAGPLCSFVGFWRVFGVQLYCFLNMSIAFNLQLVFLQNKTLRPKWELFYWLMPIIAGLLLCVPPAALNMYGKDTSGICVFDKVNSPSVLLNFLLVAFPKLITVVYCLIIAVLVIVKLSKNLSALNSTSILTVENGTHSASAQQKFVKNLIFRISLYPIFCIVCLSGSIVLNFMSIAKVPSGPVSFWAAVGNESVGIFNCIAFLLDPTFHIAIKQFYFDVFRKNNDELTHDIEIGDMNASSENKDTEISNEALLSSTKLL